MKIKLITTALPKILYSDVESLPTALPVLGDFFAKAITHRHDPYGPSRFGVNNITPKSVFFYSFGFGSAYPAEWPVVNVDVDTSSLMAFDKWDRSLLITKDELYNRLDGLGIEKDIYVIKTSVTEKTIGVIVKGANILIASDWTHDNRNIAALTSIIEQLHGLGLLRKIRKSTAKAPPINLKLGCDPELEELSHSDFMVVSPTVPHSCSAEIGVDGAGNQIEIRPKPDSEPENLVKNIEALIKKLPPVGIVGNRYPLGGHIHLGGMRPSSDLIRLLDDFVGKLSIKTSGRARGSYNHLSAYETKSYGFEYRSPASTWLHNPTIAKLIFKLVKSIVEKASSDEGLEYEYDSSGIPTLSSYEKLLTTEEAIEFISFHKNYKPDSAPININWGCEPVVIKTPNIAFRDEWVTSRSNIFYREFEALSTEFPLTFFGIRESRGNMIVANFSIEGYETEYFHPHPDRSGFWFGIPKHMRLSSSLEDAMLFVAKAKESITTILKSRTYTHTSVSTVRESTPVGYALNAGTTELNMEELREIVG